MTHKNNISIDESEVAKFSALASQWWDVKGKFGVLHKFNPVRLSYIKHHVCTHFGRNEKSIDALKGLSVLDIGCGGGLLCEPLARLGAEVTGIDPATKNIKTATIHANEQDLDIHYRDCTAETLVSEKKQYDIVLSMEVVEHVADVEAFMTSCAQLVKPGGLIFVATINRTLKAWGLAIIGAEYILRWLPKGTHEYEKLVKPEEIKTPLAKHSIDIFDETGVVFNILQNKWVKSPDMDVNYMMVGAKKDA